MHDAGYPALAAMSKRVVEKPGWKREVWGLVRTLRPEERKELPADVAQAFDALFNRLDQEGLGIDNSCLPQNLRRNGVTEARKALQTALQEATQAPEAGG